MNKYVTLAVSALSDFVITAGGAYMTLDGTAFPSYYQMSVCVVAGLVMAFRGIQKSLSAPPQ